MSYPLWFTSCYLRLSRMESSPTSGSESVNPRTRVWQDVVAETLLVFAVALIPLTGFDSFVRQLNLWLAAVLPAYDPMVTMLALMVVVISALILGSIRLKSVARRASQSRVRPARIRRARRWGTFPYVGS